MSPTLQSKSGRLPLVKVERAWLVPKPLPQAIAALFGNMWRSVPVYLRSK